MLFLILLLFVNWISVSQCRVTNEGNQAVLEGRSITIPCHYDPQYAGYVKYWCQGRLKDFCTSLTRTDTPRSAEPGATEEEKVTIFDDPVQQVFTVTMRDLKMADAGWYWCGVEVGGVWSADVTASLYIDVIHGMSVVSSRLSGEEGSSVATECLYSEKYRQSEKKWCRSGDWSTCLVTGSNGTYQDGSVLIQDDRKWAFVVTLSRLQMRDTGWYFCAAGQQQLPIHVLVTPRASTTAQTLVRSPPHQPQSKSSDLPNPKHITKDSWESQRHILESVAICTSLMLIVAMAVIARKIWSQHKKERRLREAANLKARLTDYPGDVGDLQSGSVIYLNSGTQQVHVF